MANIYTDYTNGNDSTGSGTSGAPYQTLQKAVNVANGGDTIYVANTSAQVIASGGITWNTGFAGSTAASASAPLVIKAWDNGGSLTLGGHTCWAANASAVSSGQALWNATSLPTHVYVHNMRIDSLVGSGQVTGNWKFIRCGGSGAVLASGQALLAHGAAGSGSIEECYVYNVAAAAYGILSAGTPILGCFVDGVAATGFGISGLGAVIGNIVAGVAGTGIYNAYQATIRNNTVVGDGSTASAVGIALVADGPGSTTDNLIANFAGASAAGIKAASPYKIGRMGNNAFYNNTANISGTITALDDLTADDVTETADPFVNAAGDNYALRRTAQAKGAGVPLWMGSGITAIPSIGAIQSGAGRGNQVFFA